MGTGVRRLTKVAVCIEVLIAAENEPSEFVQIVFSSPRRDGALRKTWSCPKGVVDSVQLADMHAVTFSAIQDAVMLLGGVQMTLDPAGGS